MFESLKESLSAWHGKNSERTKLQHTYIVVAVGLLVTAGVVGLLNRNLGQNILVVAIVGAGVFLTNAIVWSLLHSAVLSRITAVRRSGAKRKK